MYSLFTLARFAALDSTSISGTSASSALISTAPTLPDLMKASVSDHTASRVSGGEHWRSQRRTRCRSASRRQPRPPSRPPRASHSSHRRAPLPFGPSLSRRTGPRSTNPRHSRVGCLPPPRPRSLARSRPGYREGVLRSLHSGTAPHRLCTTTERLNQQHMWATCTLCLLQHAAPCGQPLYNTTGSGHPKRLTA